MNFIFQYIFLKRRSDIKLPVFIVLAVLKQTIEKCYYLLAFSFHEKKDILPQKISKTELRSFQGSKLAVRIFPSDQ